MPSVRIWDLPTRLFHWLLAACVIALIATAKIGGDAMNWHLRLGYAVFGLLVFRHLVPVDELLVDVRTPPPPPAIAAP